MAAYAHESTFVPRRIVVFLFIDPMYDAWIKHERQGPSGWKGQFAFASLAAAVLIFGYFGSTSFIYFQF